MGETSSIRRPARPTSRVHQHVADLGVVHQRLERTEPVDLIHDLLDHDLAIGGRQVELLNRADVRGQRLELVAQLVLGQFPGLGQVDRVDQLPVQPSLQLLERLAGIDRQPGSGEFSDHGLTSGR